MGRAITKTLQKNSFWLAIFLHLLMFFTLTYYLIPKSLPDDNRELNIPSYLYHEESTPSIAHEESPVKSTAPTKIQETSKNGIEKPLIDDTPRQLSQLIPKSAAHSSEPVHLIGEKGVAKPLIILLGKALTAHMAYPKIAVDLNVHGVAVIGFVVHPDGQVTDVRLVESSHADVLDKAAITAANQISPVKNVGLYLTEPKYIIFGIIFGSRS
jgi:TonB family protein